MSQLTVYLDEDAENLLKVHVKSSGESVSKWVAGAIKKRARSEWPADALAVLGTWGDNDFPGLDTIRISSGPDVPRETI